MKSYDVMSPVYIDEIERAIKALKRGQVILYPTDTVWGLGCDIDNSAAVERIYEIKKQKKKGNMVLIVDDIDLLKDYVEEVHPRIETLLIYHESPLTVVYPATEDIPEYMRNPENTIAVRITKDHFCQELIRGIKKPLLATLPIYEGQKDIPLNFENIDSQIKKAADYVVDINQDKSGEPSVMARYNHKGDLEFLRR